MLPDVKCRNREKRNDKERHEKTFLFHTAQFWNGFCFLLFLRKYLLHFQCYLFMLENVQVKLSEAAVHRCSSK